MVRGHDPHGNPREQLANATACGPVFLLYQKGRDSLIFSGSRGYDAFYMSGGNTSAHQLGWPDSGTSMRDMVDNARKIILTVQIPVFADADTGYGDAISTHYTVQEYIQAGIADATLKTRRFRRNPAPAAAVP